ncbi:MAG: FprA family A-type flavoprotein [Oscillospiraceae bacterium]|jgi:flavorubredoxin|nr:FprA family A-type flavoprotein [Oscillospiraceae bacterium]
MRQLSERVFYTGVLNPNMRVFDVIMRTEYGTSYNSYAVRGSAATALVDGAHGRFAGQFLEELAQALGGAEPDYLIVNHTEPDHSGAIAELLRAYPGLTIVTNAVAAKYLAQIINRADLPLRIVKDGDTLSLGDRTLRFLHAPFLHWPDTMFTYLEEEATLFPCDFFGSHYCEPGILDTAVAYPAAYESARRYYFDCIFAPFLPFVRKGLAKLEALPLRLICPSHGPVLTETGRLAETIQLYQTWSEAVDLQAPQAKKIPLFYCTAYGNTRRIGEAVRDGIRAVLPAADVELFDLTFCPDMPAMQRRLNESDAFLLAALTINRDAVPPLWELLAGADAVNIAKRPCALFGSYGWSGEGFANLAQRLGMLKCKLFEPRCKVNFVPSEDELAAAKAFGEAFAQSL